MMVSTDYTLLKMEQDPVKGCRYIADIDNITSTSFENRETAKEMVQKFVNDKLVKLKMTTLIFLILMITFVFCLALTIIIPHSIITLFKVIAILSAIGMAVLQFLNWRTYSKIIETCKTEMSKQTGDQMQMEPIYETIFTLKYMGKICTHILVKTKYSTATVRNINMLVYTNPITKPVSIKMEELELMANQSNDKLMLPKLKLSENNIGDTVNHNVPEYQNQDMENPLMNQVKKTSLMKMDEPKAVLGEKMMNENIAKIDEIVLEKQNEIEYQTGNRDITAEKKKLTVNEELDVKKDEKENKLDIIDKLAKIKSEH